MSEQQGALPPDKGPAKLAGHDPAENHGNLNIPAPPVVDSQDGYTTVRSRNKNKKKKLQVGINLAQNVKNAEKDLQPSTPNADADSHKII